tara:strand:+ start:356 stop:583 length:228 start_codon:yes stop_codon:yes gene_type:complete
MITQSTLAQRLRLDRKTIYTRLQRLLAAEKDGRPLPTLPDGRPVLPWPPEIQPRMMHGIRYVWTDKVMGEWEAAA